MNRKSFSKTVPSQGEIDEAEMIPLLLSFPVFVFSDSQTSPFFHLDEVFWRVSERRSSAEFMILKRQTTELK